MKKKRGGIVVLVLMALAVIGIFVVLAFREPKNVEQATEISEVEALLNTDILANYPATPREVMKLYNRYMLVLYGVDSEKLTDEQIKRLGQNMRALYDEELLESNPEEMHIANLQRELNAFQVNKKVMIQANVADSNEVDYIEINEKSGATVEVSYFIKKGTQDFTRTHQQYLLRKDAQGNWKILNYSKVNGGAS
ncbi:MAG: hypothetical protein J6B28_09905 [Eubacterium sp.]|nr:hypothetical protein [Eubacterium sp.]